MSKSAFPHRRPATTTKRRRGFLDLPGEVRNQIYQYCFNDGFRCEIAAKGAAFDQLSKPRKKIKLCVGMMNPERNVHPQVKKKPVSSPENKIRISRRLGNRNQYVQRESTKWPTSLCPLILVCKSIHAEVIPLLYRNTTFVFDAPKRISKFLSTVPRKNLSYITKLELHYFPYNPALMICDLRNFEEAHHVAWVRACRATSMRLVNLQNLTISIYASFAKRTFDLRQDIITPFLQFRRLSVGKDRPLQTVTVNFTSWWSLRAFGENGPLADASVALHRLYGNAIGKAILGANETDAMAELLNAWHGEYAIWQHHLDFLGTGW